ncbi:hypothetical protein HZ994_10060 [Akkermansiaceae bacterium]|nr:hypothetical protein HZ994_10060 [Akkermansiaceae bacterium]
MKNRYKTAMTAGILAAFAGQAYSGSIMEVPVAAGDPESAFEGVRRPISNPTLFDLALPTTNIHPIFMHHNLPSTVNTTPLGNLPMGGDVQVYALQFEYALSERLSIVATKDGFVDINPGNGLWGNESGFANLGAGLKYAFIYDPANEFVLSGTAVVELPTGNDDVFQGQGEGMVNLIVSALKMYDDLQLAGAVGGRFAVSDDQSSSSFVSMHASYEVTPWFIPLVELNWHHVLSPGDGAGAFNSQAGGLVPVVATFEGSDLLNFGAANSGSNRDLVTAAFGFRSRVADGVDLGFAYEIPLTPEDDGIIEDRITLDLVWRF